MAKTRHNNFMDTVTEILQDAKDKGITQLYTEDKAFTGRHIRVNGKELAHFGTTSYLGLDQDLRLKEAAVKAIWDYGTQFPLSKSYISHSVYKELEEKLHTMYGHPVIVTKNSTLGHLGIVPTVVRDEDAIILDHQVHWSVQNAAQISKSRGVHIEMIRHNSLEMLEDNLRKLSTTRQKIWYFADGIYSMYGDAAPIDELNALAKKYPQLHIYYDDVHGMSWTGKKGTGYVKSFYEEMPDNVIIIGTLSKTFGASGSFMVTGNEEMHRQVRNFGGPLTFSAQLEPSAVAAANASATIHLSDEIYEMQEDLREKVAYCNSLLEQTELPLIEKNNCPVFYIGSGAPVIGFDVTKTLLDEGFFVNTGLFPAVPVKNTGTRFTVCRHNTKEDIKALVDCLAYHHPRIVEKHGYTQNKVRKYFKLPLLEEKKDVSKDIRLTTQVLTDIAEVPKEEWNAIFGTEGMNDYEALRITQNYFSDRPLPEEKYDYRYVIIRDGEGKIVLATYLTLALWKDDMLANARTSVQIESRREKDPYLLTSKVLSVGSLVTEGEMLFLDKSHEQSQDALEAFFICLEKLDEELNPDMIVLRDFVDDDPVFKRTMFNKGFVKVEMPVASVVEEFNWHDHDSYVASLSAKSRRNFKKDVQPFLELADMRIAQELTEPELDRCYELVKNVWRNNRDLNTFFFSKEFFAALAAEDAYEMILLYDKEQPELPCAVLFCYTSSANVYVPVLIGMDYDIKDKLNSYRQMLYYAIMRAKEIDASKLFFGFTAAFEKRKLGAVNLPKVAYIQAKDNFSMEMMEATREFN